MKKNSIIFITILLLAFIALTILTITNNIKFFDDTIYNTLIKLRSPFFDFYFKNITKLGNTVSILIIVIIFLLILKKEDGILLGISTISSVIVNTIIKYIIKRPRPTHLRLISQGGYSFPSGHAMISICVYGMLLYLIHKNIKNKTIKYFLTIFIIFLIISIGLSRIYVGVHYPSDILAGYLLSISILIIIIKVYIKNSRRNKSVKTHSK